MTWQDQLNFDPLSPLLNSKNIYIEYFARRDLLSEDVRPLDKICMLDQPQKILKKQQLDGSWKSFSKNKERLSFNKLWSN